MKAKVVRGNGFRGVLDYASDNEKCSEVIRGTMSSTTPRELAREFSITRQLRPDAVKPVWHSSLALPAGETVSSEEWESIATRYMEKMEIADHQWVAFRHDDTDHQHIHIVASRIGLDGSLWHGKWEAMNAITATQELEKEFGLTLTTGLKGPSEKKRPSFNEIQQAVRDGEPLPRVVLQEIVDSALEGGDQSIFAFIERVEAAGVTALPNVAKTGKMNGFSFEIDGIAFKASQLGKGYSWKNLQEKGVIYEQDRDCDELIETASRIKNKVNEVIAPAAEGGRELADESRKEREADGGEFSSQGRRDRPEPERASRTNRGESEGNSVSYRRDFEESGQFGLGSKENDSEGKEVSRAPGEGWQQAFVEGIGSVIDMRDSQWSIVHGYTSDLAAPLDRSTVGTQSISEMKPDHKKKVLAWREQHKALQSPFYRVTAKPRLNDNKTINFGKQKDGGEIQYTANQVESLIPQLRQKNATGYDIYITPLDPNNHYLVVDDLTTDKLAELKKETQLSPCLIQESSENNYQAIIKAEKENHPKEQSLANQLVQRINKKYGDANFSGVIHPFRMAGFSNKKPGRNNVFTRVIEATGRICGHATDLLKGLRSKFDAQHRAEKEAILASKVNKEQERRLARMEEGLGDSDDRIAAAYRDGWRRHVGLAKSMGWQLDYSVVDFRVAKDLLKDGHDAADIGYAIMSASPGLLDRHSNDPEGYVARTISKARIEVDKAKEAERPEQGYIPKDDSGPEMGR
jgi:hypothetical protein